MNRALALAFFLAVFLVGISRAAPLDEDLIFLVVHSASDCPVCKSWRVSTEGLSAASQLSKEWPQLKIVVIERPSLNGSESESLYPPELQLLYQARRDRYQLSPAVPLFELVRNNQLVSRHAGLQGWLDGTLLELQKLRQGSTASTTVR